MTKRDDISSTEKLLDAIRNKDNGSEEEISEFSSEKEYIEDDIPQAPPPQEIVRNAPVHSEQVEPGDVPPKGYKPASASDIPPVTPVNGNTTAQSESKSPLKSLTGVKTMVVGVAIHHASINLVMINRLSVHNRELVKYKKVPFAPGINRDSKQFPEFLQTVLRSFCGSYGNLEIWASIPDETLENRYLTIPRMSDKKMGNGVYWTFRKEVPFDESEMIFDFEVIGDVIEDTKKKTAISAYVVNRQLVNGLKTLFSDIKFPLTGVSVAPFALQNFFRTKGIDTEGKKLCTVNIGLEHSRIDIFSENNLIMSRNVKTGIDSMIGAIREETEETILFDGLPEDDEDTDALPVLEIETFDNSRGNGAQETSDYTQSNSPTIDDLVNSELEIARQYFLDIVTQSKTVILTEQEEILHEVIFGLISPVVERLLRQIERTFEYYARTYRTSSPEIIIFTGPTSTYKKMTEYISSQLGLEAGIIDPFAAAHQLAPTVPPPRSLTEKESFVHAYGLALSDISHTPNLLYTFRQKKRDKQVKLVNAGIFSAFILLLLICCGVLFGMNRQMSVKDGKMTELRTALNRFVPNVDQGMLQDLYAQIQKKKKIMKKYALTCMGTAVISEITIKTPDSIRLTALEAELFSPSETMKKMNADREDAGEGPAIKPKKLIIEGYVTDESMSLESTLAGYLIRLKSSPIFGKVTIQNKKIVVLDEEEVLNFKAIVEMS